MSPLDGQRSRASRAGFIVAAGLLTCTPLAGAQQLRDSNGLPVSVTAAAFEPRSAPGETPFTRYDGSLFGLDQPNLFSPRDFYPPFFNGGGIASGDIDRDGWPDVATANGSLINIYTNERGERFARTEIDVTGIDDASIFNVALVDIDGDGWLDLFGTTYLYGNFYLLNQGGRFTSEGLRQPPRGNAVLSSTAAFGDIDRDGDLDAVIGNWFAGASKKHPPPHSQNEIWINRGGEFEVSPLPEMVGETLSTLLSDWSGDGWLDLVVGNDFEDPDMFYLNDGKGGFDIVERRSGLLPHSTQSTMSIDSGDFDNDLDLDLFIDQITARATGPSAQMQILSLQDYCDDIVVPAVRERCEANMATRRGFFYGANHRPTNVRNCLQVPDPTDRQQCVGMQVMMTAQRLRKPEICDGIPETETRTYTLCRSYFELVYPHDPDMLQEAIPQRMNENVLLVMDAEAGRFRDQAERAGVGFTGWSWNARFADVDNDEWQDIYVAAGSWFRATPSGTTANFFFHNNGNGTFSDRTEDSGLQNFMIVSAYTIIDFDRDGDLDFISNSINGPLWLFRNNAQTGHSIAFRVRDAIGNRDGIGTRFTISYGPDGERRQMRELKASGGYLSFDDPLAHFGLGQYDSVSSVEIAWSTGGTTVIPGPLAAGRVYSIERSAE